MTYKRPEPIATRFYLEGIGDEQTSFSGITYGYTWNGFECPLFPKAEADRIVRLFEQRNKEDPETDGFRLRWKGDNIVIEDPTCWEEPDYEPEICKPDENGYYSLGSHAWCWGEEPGVRDVYDPDNEADFCKVVCDVLSNYGIKACYEYPGYVNFEMNGRDVAIGTLNGDWSADFSSMDDPSVRVGSSTPSLPLTSTPLEVAEFCLTVIKEIRHPKPFS